MSQPRKVVNFNQMQSAPSDNYLDHILDSDEEESDEKNEPYLPPDLSSASETPAASSADSNCLTSALETVKMEQSEASPEPVDELTMEQEIRRLSDSDRRVYQDLYVELRNEHRQSGKYFLFTMGFPTEQLREGATEHVNGYTSEQAVRFLAMTKMAEKRGISEEMQKSIPKLTEGIESAMVGRAVGHYGIYQISDVGKNFVSAEAYHENLEEISTLRIDETSTILYNGARYLFCLDSLMIGDTIAVKKIRNSEGTNVVHTFCLFRRSIVQNQTLNIGKAMRAVVFGTGEVAAPKDESHSAIGVESSVHNGDVFYPVKMRMNRGPEIAKPNRNLVTAMPLVLNFEKNRELYNIENSYSRSNFQYNEQLVNYCGVMGSSALVAARKGLFDGRKHSVSRWSFEMLTSGDAGFSVKMKLPATGFPRQWFPGMPIYIQDVGRGEITQKLVNKAVHVIVKATGDFDSTKFADTTVPSRLVHQIGKEQVPPCLQPGFFEQMADGSNGKKIITALFGGLSIGENGVCTKREGYSKGKVSMLPSPVVQILDSLPPTNHKYSVTPNNAQATYIHRISQQKLPITVGAFPIISGKSTTVAIAAHEAATARPETQQIVFLPDENRARVFATHFENVVGKGAAKPVRFISVKQWKMQPRSEDTSIDYPVLLTQFLQKLISENRTARTDLSGTAKSYLKSMGSDNKLDEYWLNIFFDMVRPQIVISTFESLFSNPTVLQHLNNVSTVQFDDSDQIPQSDVVQTCVQYPLATYGLMGDTAKDHIVHECFGCHQGRISTGQLVEKATEWKIFPTVNGKVIYSVNTRIAEMIGKLYYQNDDFTGSEKIGDVIQMRGDIWTNEYPIKIVDHKFGAQKEDKDLVPMMMSLLQKLYQPQDDQTAISPEKIGVMCSTQSQMIILSEILKNSGIYCGYLESFTGNQKEIVVVWGAAQKLKGKAATMEETTSIIASAKQSIIIFDSAKHMEYRSGDRKGRGWGDLVKIVQENNGLTQATVS
ncbi:hypothetical protein GCK72_022825 [Caenorhabditis remanei]|uniref:Uncharacterized protein n=1 Tax=Caenorhabditis remanei TaxID=31234 RepID=A0A6A5FVD5_CAERE|nr:hypothetical protein GCK72_022825 [Caenorhabditis remanei]KAF1746371.1 hypothetical protein GCK72_022825 [Caenorhabditis remanei]